MAEVVIRRGLDIPIKGRASGEPVDLPAPSTVAYSPTEFPGLTPRLSAREGDVVKKGDPLVYDKNNPDLVLVSPVAGHVKEVRRGKRRVITDVVVEVGEGGAREFPKHDLAALKSISREDAIAQLLSGGMWVALRTRPLDRLADPENTPQSILISAHETGPLMPGAAELLGADAKDALQAGIYVLKALTQKVMLATGGGSHPALSGLDGVEVSAFSGPHPAGDPSVQVNYLDAPRGTNEVWYARAWDVADIGRLFLDGEFPAERVYAAVGAGAKAPRLVKTLLGAPLKHIVGEVAEGDQRWIRGSVLTGKAVDGDRWASFYNRGIHILPDSVPRELFGWTTPQLGKFSFHRAFLSGFMAPSGEHDLRPGLWGGVRAMVPVGFLGKVVATPDILPEFLFKSIIAGDLEESIELGMLDISMEEAALITYISPSKIEYDVILAEGLERYAKEA